MTVKKGRLAARLASLGAVLIPLAAAATAQAAEYCAADKNVVASTDAGLDAAADSWNSGAWAGYACVHLILTNDTNPIGTSKTFSTPAKPSATQLVIRKLSTNAAATIDKVLKVQSPNVTVYRLKLLKGLMIGGDNSRALRNEAWDDNTNQFALAAILIQKGRNVRVAFNTIHSSTVGIRLNKDTAILSPRIDHNLLTDQYAPGFDPNLHEPIQVGQSAGSRDYSHHAIVEWNYISVPKVEGDDEAISVKTSDNIIRYNTLVDSTRLIMNRQGHGNQYIANYIENALGIFLLGADNKAISNYVDNGTVGKKGITVMAGDTPANGSGSSGSFAASLRDVVYGNTASSYWIGHVYASYQTVYPADQTSFYNNKVIGKAAEVLSSCTSSHYIWCNQQINTSFAPMQMDTFTPRKLSPGETGVNGQPWVD